MNKEQIDAKIKELKDELEELSDPFGGSINDGPLEREEQREERKNLRSRMSKLRAQRKNLKEDFLIEAMTKEQKDIRNKIKELQDDRDSWKYDDPKDWHEDHKKERLVIMRQLKDKIDKLRKQLKEDYSLTFKDLLEESELSLNRMCFNLKGLKYDLVSINDPREKEKIKKEIKILQNKIKQTKKDNESD